MVATKIKSCLQSTPNETSRSSVISHQRQKRRTTNKTIVVTFTLIYNNTKIGCKINDPFNSS